MRVAPSIPIPKFENLRSFGCMHILEFVRVRWVRLSKVSTSGQLGLLISFRIVSQPYMLSSARVTSHTMLYHPFTFLTLIGPLRSAKLSTSTTAPFCITSTSPASLFSHTICRTSSMVSLHSDASNAHSSSVDSARAISEGQIVFGQALVLNRRWAWRDRMVLLASSRAILFVQLANTVYQLADSMCR